MQTIGNVWLWGGFALVVIAALLVDLVLMRHGGTHKVTFREATWWSIGWLRRVGGGACRDLRRTQRADGCLLWQPWVPFFALHGHCRLRPLRPLLRSIWRSRGGSVLEGGH
ncbi:hypothetical protein ACU10_20745 [Xanthomonas oryzae pv. oryzicola]|uniref:hypothetical protein n=1 Tax=Xanthomonas oryzae TaxID=347 RepID=UPI0006560073|nr:hypothetical protein [Xanthomonas oryzae]AKN95068.1 hypothetical protein ACU13_20770 [Xanthomonas oryzae pv. oryzicola]AKN98796.1 hypothetical protein ACU10_20745 [Xanthomonas oryzae pv. oryzicola]AKO14016.1 hypothetical protein ACU14_20710 [Xanthomonas oryzae pv. oryzicola]AKO17756.1 hypothetical protein ACU12_20770 [Xanthomonas oryzae pv. oryzicola]